MKLLEKIDQHRRDFKGKYECQGCGSIEIDNSFDSYDDDNFHDNVIPAMKCEKCGESTNTLGVANERMSTRFAPYETV